MKSVDQTESEEIPKSPRMLSNRRCIRRVVGRRVATWFTIPATVGINAAAPAPINAMAVRTRAERPILSASSSPMASPMAACEAATTPVTGRFSPNLDKENWDIETITSLKVLPVVFNREFEQAIA